MKKIRNVIHLLFCLRKSNSGIKHFQGCNIFSVKMSVFIFLSNIYENCYSREQYYCSRESKHVVTFEIRPNSPYRRFLNDFRRRFHFLRKRHFRFYTTCSSNHISIDFHQDYLIISYGVKYHI